MTALKSTAYKNFACNDGSVVGLWVYIQSALIQQNFHVLNALYGKAL